MSRVGHLDVRSERYYIFGKRIYNKDIVQAALCRMGNRLLLAVARAA